jgi:hypothetical protein
MSDPDVEKFSLDVVRLMKVISDAQRKYIEGISVPADMPHNNATLVAMHALSIMCSLQRGYSQKDMDEVHGLAVTLAHNLYKMRQENVDTQVANMTPDGSYRN